MTRATQHSYIQPQKFCVLRLGALASFLINCTAYLLFNHKPQINIKNSSRKAVLVLYSDKVQYREISTHQTTTQPQNQYYALKPMYFQAHIGSFHAFRDEPTLGLQTPYHPHNRNAELPYVAFYSLKKNEASTSPILSAPRASEKQVKERELGGHYALLPLQHKDRQQPATPRATPEGCPEPRARLPSGAPRAPPGPEPGPGASPAAAPNPAGRSLTAAGGKAGAGPAPPGPS